MLMISNNHAYFTPMFNGTAGSVRYSTSRIVLKKPVIIIGGKKIPSKA